MSAMEPGTLKKLGDATNLQLPRSEQQALLNVLLSFPDVFNEGLGHNSVTDHKIDTGDSPPIYDELRGVESKKTTVLYVM